MSNHDEQKGTGLDKGNGAISKQRKPYTPPQIICLSAVRQTEGKQSSSGEYTSYDSNTFGPS